MLVVKILDLLLLQSSQFRIDIPPLPLAIVHLHPPQQRETQDKDRSAGPQVEAVACWEIRSVCGNEGPGGDEAADVSKPERERKSAKRRDLG
jgi:hypothetical protein